jgi:hypothetical protein
VLQGQPSEFKLTVPTGYEITDVSGATVDGSEISDSELTVKLSASAPRTHQFLISMEKQLSGAAKVETPFVGFPNTQRETGEVLVEGVGAMELTAHEGGSLKRMDLKEVNQFLRSLSHYPLQAAFRFHRQPNEAPTLSLDWVRFPDSAVLAAVAERAVVTTMVTTEGRSLTEVKLTVKNQAQPFLKVDLPADATILTAEVAGEKVKPVQGPDGARVPLLRAGFRPTDAYEVSFVFLHSGAPFARKGGSELSLPSMDVPISVLQWEVYLPEQYKVKDFGGDAISESLLAPRAGDANIQLDFNNLQHLNGPTYELNGYTAEYGRSAGSVVNTFVKAPGQLGGVIIDPSGAVIQNAQVKVTSQDGTLKMATTDSLGQWTVYGVPSGDVKIEASARGFNTSVYDRTPYDANHPSQYSMPLNVGTATSVVEVTAESPMSEARKPADKKRDERKDQVQQQASANVFNLQKKVAGVLPVRVDVPRAGSSYRFARALVLDEETKLTFSYRTK